MSNTTSQTDETTTRELIFQYIVQYKRAHDGNTPSLREIAEACNLSSPSSVQYHLFWLEMEGRIRMFGERRRAIEIVGASGTTPTPVKVKRTLIVLGRTVLMRMIYPTHKMSTNLHREHSPMVQAVKAAMMQ